MGGARGTRARPIIEDQRVFYYNESTQYFILAHPAFKFEPTQYFFTITTPLIAMIPNFLYMHIF